GDERSPWPWAFSLYCGCTWAPARFPTGRTSVDVGTAWAWSVRGMTDAIRRSARRRRISAGATLHIVRDRAGGRMYGDAAGADTIHGAAGHAHIDVWGIDGAARVHDSHARRRHHADQQRPGCVLPRRLEPPRRRRADDV